MSIKKETKKRRTEWVAAPDLASIVECRYCGKPGKPEIAVLGYAWGVCEFCSDFMSSLAEYVNSCNQNGHRVGSEALAPMLYDVQRYLRNEIMLIGAGESKGVVFLLESELDLFRCSYCCKVTNDFEQIADKDAAEGYRNICAACKTLEASKGASGGAS